MSHLEYGVSDKMPKDQEWALRCKLEGIPQKSAALILRPYFKGETPAQSQVSRLTKKAVAAAETLVAEMFGTAQMFTGGIHVQEVYRDERGGSEPARRFTIDGDPIRPLTVDPYNKDSQVKSLSANRTLRPVEGSTPESHRDKIKRDEFGGSPFFSDTVKVRKERHDKWLAEHAAIWEPIRQRRRKLFTDLLTMEKDAVA